MPVFYCFAVTWPNKIQPYKMSMTLDWAFKVAQSQM